VPISGARFEVGNSQQPNNSRCRSSLVCSAQGLDRGRRLVSSRRWRSTPILRCRTGTLFGTTLVLHTAFPANSSVFVQPKRRGTDIIRCSNDGENEERSSEGRSGRPFGWGWLRSALRPVQQLSSPFKLLGNVLLLFLLMRVWPLSGRNTVGGDSRSPASWALHLLYLV
jgi:hypothetical protein